MTKTRLTEDMSLLAPEIIRFDEDGMPLDQMGMLWSFDELKLLKEYLDKYLDNTTDFKHKVNHNRVLKKYNPSYYERYSLDLEDHYE